VNELKGAIGTSKLYTFVHVPPGNYLPTTH